MARARKRGRPKKKKTGVSTELIGVMLLVVNSLAIGQFGFVGRFFANVLRFFVGETYIIASIAMIIIGIYLLIKGNRPSLKSPKWIGSFLVFCAVVVWQHAIKLFSPIMDANVNIVNATWRMYLPQFKSISIGQNIGGGMIGAILYAISYFLFRQPARI